MRSLLQSHWVWATLWLPALMGPFIAGAWDVWNPGLLTSTFSQLMWGRSVHERVTVPNCGPPHPPGQLLQVLFCHVLSTLQSGSA